MKNEKLIIWEDLPNDAISSLPIPEEEKREFAKYMADVLIRIAMNSKTRKRIEKEKETLRRNRK